MTRKEIIEILKNHIVDLFAHGLRYGYETNIPLLEQIADEILALPIDKQDVLDEANKLILSLTEDVRKLRFMIDNGLGWEDIRDDIIYPHEI